MVQADQTFLLQPDQTGHSEIVDCPQPLWWHMRRVELAVTYPYRSIDGLVQIGPSIFMVRMDRSICFHGTNRSVHLISWYKLIGPSTRGRPPAAALVAHAPRRARGTPNRSFYFHGTN